MKASRFLRVACLLAASGCGASSPTDPAPSTPAKGTVTSESRRIADASGPTAQSPAPSPSQTGLLAPVPLVPPAPPPLPEVSWVPLPPPPPPPGAKQEVVAANVLSGDAALKEMVKRAEAIERTDVRIENEFKTIQVDYRDGSKSYHKVGPFGSIYEFHPAK